MRPILVNTTNGLTSGKKCVPTLMFAKIVRKKNQNNKYGHLYTKEAEATPGAYFC